METILHSFSYSIEYLQDQVSDVHAALICSQPGTVANHPAWTIGHLTFALNMLGGLIGAQQPLPDDWPRLFGPESIPTPDVTAYPLKQELMTRLLDVHQRIVSSIHSLSDEQLDAIFPEEAYRDVFPTIRHALTQVLIGHTAFHVGQVAVWRRAMGLAPMTRSFE